MAQTNVRQRAGHPPRHQHGECPVLRVRCEGRVLRMHTHRVCGEGTKMASAVSQPALAKSARTGHPQNRWRRQTSVKGRATRPVTNTVSAPFFAYVAKGGCYECIRTGFVAKGQKWCRQYRSPPLQKAQGRGTLRIDGADKRPSKGGPPAPSPTR